jgi:hypothetical protein
VRLGDITAGLDASGNPILTTDGVSQIDPASVCMPQGWYGPLAPGQVMCSAPANTPAGGAASTSTSAAVCPVGSTCSFVPGIADTTIYLAVAAVAALFFFAANMGGRR